MSATTVPTLALAACLSAACLDAHEVSEPPPTTGDAAKLVAHANGIPDRYIVVLDPAHRKRAAGTPVRLDDLIDRLALDHRAEVAHRYRDAFEGFSAALTEADALALAARPEIWRVEQDTIDRLDAIPYGLDRIDQRDLPLDARFTPPGTGAGTTVYVIDSGINPTHLDFAGRVREDLGFTTVDDGGGIEDCNGHGTHVSGTIGGTVFGVAKQTTIVPVRVFDCQGAAPASSTLAGMDFVARTHAPRAVVNMSLGGAASDAKDLAVRALVASGVTVVVAAGNSAQDACSQSPAREPLAITVASSTADDARSSFSNFGSCVDLFAPGSDIVSAGIDDDTAVATLSGTSMATPHVAGAVAVLLSSNPSATPAELAAELLGTATPGKIADVRGSPNRLLFTGAPGDGGGDPGGGDDDDDDGDGDGDDDDLDEPGFDGGCSAGGAAQIGTFALIVLAIRRKRGRR